MNASHHWPSDVMTFLDVFGVNFGISPYSPVNSYVTFCGPTALLSNNLFKSTYWFDQMACFKDSDTLIVIDLFAP